MKQQKLLYAILLLGIIFLIIFINKKIFLEGYTYTYNSDLTFNGTNLQPLIGSFDDTTNQVNQSTCEIQCDALPGCTGFTTTNINNNKGIGNCTFYNNSNTDLKHLKDTNIFLK